jgi:hypothetical protein
MKEEIMIATRPLLAVIAVLVMAVPAAAQESWSWNSRLAAGQTIEIKGVNGAVRATAASGDEVRVTARKTARRNDPAEVRIEVIEHAAGVTICAVYPSRGEPNECRPGTGGRNNVQNNDVQVEFTVQVPRGINFVGRSVNGAIEASGITANAAGHTVNGAITMDVAGTAQGRTVNGAINVTMGRADWRDRLEFETVNGSITVTFAGEVNTRVTASTVNGSIDTDFPLEVRGRFGPRRVDGTIGSGGRELLLSTVNGGIRLRRR